MKQKSGKTKKPQKYLRLYVGKLNMQGWEIETGKPQNISPEFKHIHGIPKMEKEYPAKPARPSYCLIPLSSIKFV